MRGKAPGRDRRKCIQHRIEKPDSHRQGTDDAQDGQNAIDFQDSPRVCPRATDQIVGFGLCDSQAFRHQTRLHYERQGEYDDAQSSVPLHPGAGKKKRRRRADERRLRAQPRGRHAGDGFKEGIQKTQPRAHHRVGHHERGEEKHQRDQHHAFIGLHPGRSPQPGQAGPKGCKPARPQCHTAG